MGNQSPNGQGAFDFIDSLIGLFHHSRQEQTSPPPGKETSLNRQFETALETLDETIEKENRVKLYNRNFLKLSTSCQEILKLIARGFTVNELTEELGHKSTGFTYKKRRVCKERLIKLIKEELKY